MLTYIVWRKNNFGHKCDASEKPVATQRFEQKILTEVLAPAH